MRLRFVVGFVVVVSAGCGQKGELYQGTDIPPPPLPPLEAESVGGESPVPPPSVEAESSGREPPVPFPPLEPPAE